MLATLPPPMLAEARALRERMGARMQRAAAMEQAMAGGAGADIRQYLVRGAVAGAHLAPRVSEEQAPN